MKKIFLLMGILLCFTYLICLIDYCPQNHIAELFTATWCDYCPEAYAGLSIMEEQYTTDEFRSVRLYSSSNNGGYSIPEYLARRNYYGVQYLPTVLINGENMIVGAGEYIITGSAYQEILSSCLLKPTQLSVRIEDFNAATGNVSALVTMKSNSLSLQNAVLVFYLIEDNITEEVTHCVRDIIEVPFSLAGQNNTFTCDQNFDMTYTSNPDQLKAIVLVQDSNKKIYNSCSSIPLPEFNVRAVYSDQSWFTGPINSTLSGPDFTLFNQGNPLDLTVSVVSDEGPSTEFTLGFCDNNSCYFDEYTFSLAEGGTRTFHPSINVSSPGMQSFHFLVTSPQLEQPLIIPYRFIPEGTEVLVVDKNYYNTFSHVKACLDSLNIQYAVWNPWESELTPEILNSFQTVIWSSKCNSPVLTDSEKLLITQYLQIPGKNLFIYGSNIAIDLGYSESRFYDLNYMHNTLHSELYDFGESLTTISGNSGTFLNNVSFNINDGTVGSTYFIGLNTWGNNSYPLLSAEGMTPAIYSDANGSKLVFFTFSFEAINNPDSREQVMGKILEYFDVINDNHDESIQPMRSSRLLSVYPNPFNPEVKIRFEIAGKDIPEISVYNLKGQKVKSLISDQKSAGVYEISWNGENEIQQRVSSGMYLIVLKSRTQTSVKKILLLK